MADAERTKRLVEQDDDDDEDDDEYDEDEDEESEEEREQKRSSKSKKRSVKRSKPTFLAEYADEGSDEEEVEGEGEIESDGMEDILTAEQREKRDRRFAQDRAFREMNDEDAVKLARDLQRRSRQEQSADYAQKGTTGGAATIETARLLRERPTASDPKLFMVRCKPGEEKALIIKLYNKYIQNKTRKPELVEAVPTSRWSTAVAPGAELEIYSVLAPGASGYIYVEAKREDNVKAALRGVLGVYASHTSVVPLDEMQDVVRVELRKEAIRKDDYVRMRGPFPYKGDLAKVHSVLEGGNRITVKVVPRIDMQRVSLNLDKNAPKGVPPPAKHFNPDEIRALGGTISREQHDGEMMDNFDDHFFDGGLLFLEVNQRQVQVLTEKPGLHELEHFISPSSNVGNAAGSSREDVDIMSSELSKVKQKKETFSFAVGDKVRVVDGAEKGAEGVLKNVDTLRNKGTVLVGDLLIDVKFMDLAKLFNPGDHVKVISGKHIGKTGTVVSVPRDLTASAKPFVHIYTDMTSEEIEVFNSELQVSAEVSAGIDELNGYKLHDLVMLDHNMHGVIVRVNPDSVGVLIQTGEVRTIPTSAIRAKKSADSLRASAPDLNSQMLKCSDHVSVVAGPYRGADGVVKHIFKMMLFLHSKSKESENGGIYVVKSKDCRLAGSLQGSGTNRPLAIGGGTAAGGPPSAASRATFNPNLGRAKQDALQGKTVRIRKGNDKGLQGIVRAGGSSTYVRVELNARNRIVNVPRDDVELVESKPLESFSMPPPAYNAPAPYGAPNFPGSRFGMPPPYAGQQQQVYATPMSDFDSKPAVPAVEAPTSAKAQYKEGDEVTVVETGESVTIIEVMDKDIVIKDSKGKIRIVTSSNVVYG